MCCFGCADKLNFPHFSLTAVFALCWTPVDWIQSCLSGRPTDVFAPSKCRHNFHLFSCSLLAAHPPITTISPPLCYRQMGPLSLDPNPWRHPLLFSSDTLHPKQHTQEHSNFSSVLTAEQYFSSSKSREKLQHHRITCLAGPSFQRVSEATKSPFHFLLKS